MPTALSTILAARGMPCMWLQRWQQSVPIYGAWAMLVDRVAANDLCFDGAA